MKIVFLIDQLYRHGGAEKVLSEKSTYFTDKFNYDVTIITTEQEGKVPCYPLSSKVTLIDIGIDYERSKSYFNIVNIKKVIYHYKTLKKQIKEINPDFIILLSNAFDYYFLPYISSNSKIFKEFHSSYYFNSIEKGKNKSLLKKTKFFIRDYINNKYDSLIVLNNDEKKLLNYKNTIVIPNGIPIHESEFSSLENMKVISAGRIAPVKNFESLIKSWTYINNQYPDWQLEIYGEGDSQYFLELQELISKLNLSNTIAMKGSTNQLKKEMLDSSIYIMTSITECFPMVLLEAKDCGLPIVSFDCPTGPRNIIVDEEDGFLVENQNMIKLSNKIITLIKSIDIRKDMGKKAKENIKHYELKEVMKMWQLLFEKSIKNV